MHKDIAIAVLNQRPLFSHSDHFFLATWFSLSHWLQNRQDGTVFIYGNHTWYS